MVQVVGCKDESEPVDPAAVLVGVHDFRRAEVKNAANEFQIFMIRSKLKTQRLIEEMNSNYLN